MLASGRESVVGSLVSASTVRAKGIARVSSSGRRPLRKVLRRGCLGRAPVLTALIGSSLLLAALAAGAPSPVGAAEAISAPCVFWGAAHACESSNPNVTLEVINEHETSLCTFHEGWTWGDGSAAGEATLRGSVEGSRQLLASHTYGQPGTYAISVTGYVMAEESGLEYTCEAPPEEYKFTLLAGGAVLAGKEVKAPVPAITNVSQSHRVWREGTKLAMVSQARRAPIGTTFSFTLNEQATVSFAFTQVASKTKRRCAAKKHSPNSKCKPAARVGSFSFTGHGGTNTVNFQGRISAAKRLATGNYTLTIAASDGHQASPVRSLSFSVVK